MVGLHGDVSLHDMIELLAVDIVGLWPGLQNIAWGFSMDGEDATTPEEAKAVLDKLNHLCIRAGWDDLAKQSQRLLQRAKNGERGAVMTVLAEDLREAFQAKLSNLHLVVIEDRDAALYKLGAKAVCNGPLSDTLAISEEEMNLAGRAFACGLSTASVSHAMRAVEASLHVLASKLGISFSAPVQLQDWAVLTDKIQSEINRRKNDSRSADKTETLKVLSDLIICADHFRLAWRNHVQHAREKYDSSEARPILVHVGAYLGKLSDAASSPHVS